MNSHSDLQTETETQIQTETETETQNQYSILVFICIYFQFQPERVRICEHCLKITRAPTAYEQCCTDQDNAFSWCRRIYHFSQSNGKR